MIGFGFTRVVTFKTFGSQILIRSERIRSSRVKPERNCVCNNSPTDLTRRFCSDQYHQFHLLYIHLLKHQ